MKFIHNIFAKKFNTIKYNMLYSFNFVRIFNCYEDLFRFLNIILHEFHCIIMISTTKTLQSLNKVIKFNKIEFQNGNPYNLRWQWKWRSAFYTYPKDNFEPTQVKKPEDSPVVRPLGYTYWQDLLIRIFPTAQMYWNRRQRILDPFQIYVLPSIAFLLAQGWNANNGFKIMTLLTCGMFYTRMRDRCADPDIKETYLRDMIHKNAEISQLFTPETIHVLDYDLEYDSGIPDDAKFPEYRSKLWRFFNTDASFTTGFFKFGDVESGAVMNLKVRV